MEKTKQGPLCRGAATLLLAILVLVLSGCGPRQFDDAKAYFRYLADPENGLCADKSVGGLRYRVRYLPADWMVFNQTDGFNYTAAVKDSLRRQYSQSLTFLVNIGPAAGEDFDITRLGVTTYEEFATRIEKMAFQAADWIHLEQGGAALRPVIARMEAVNSVERSRNFVVVFATESGTTGDLRCRDLCLCYDDQLFGTGMNKFVFKAADLQAAPSLKL